MGVLYVVATPIGNLEDITLRALRVLREVGLIAAEDTRTTVKLLNRFKISTPMVSFFEHNELVRRDEILQALVKQDVALVSEAGMPTISDPGYRLVQAAIAQGVPIVPVPGPSAVLAALAVSGLPTDSFLFLGFLPRRRGARQRRLAAVRDQPQTLICFEAPHRLLATLRDMKEIFGDRQLAVACELTKMYEEVWRGTVHGALERFEQAHPRGEFTLVVAGALKEDSVWEETRVRRALVELISTGVSRRDAVAQVATLAQWSKRAVYRLAVEGSTSDDKRRRANA
ncbi:MAG: 16S rRNA (cytidine(1402)-2'-O)-methyltransferase [Anaerolineales bacterium]|jgi:16S rRNA (cytidine1402-2'-O)-methyltransferase|nr:MAG: 16S rRNA (cytidine(1402)-2'-O)-methyltransferase [Anaerolineales bacterium]